MKEKEATHLEASGSPNPALAELHRETLEGKHKSQDTADPCGSQRLNEYCSEMSCFSEKVTPRNCTKD